MTLWVLVTGVTWKSLADDRGADLGLPDIIESSKRNKSAWVMALMRRAPLFVQQSLQGSELQRRELCLGKLLCSSTLGVHLNPEELHFLFYAEVATSCAFYFPPRFALWVRKLSFFWRKSGCSCLGSFCWRQWQSLSCPCLSLQSISALSPELSLLLGVPGWLLRSHGNQHHSLPLHFVFVGICWDLEQCSTPPHLWLLPGLVLCGVFWFSQTPDNPEIAVEWMNSAPVFHHNEMEMSYLTPLLFL